MKQLFRVESPYVLYPFGYTIRHAIQHENGELHIAKQVEYVAVPINEPVVTELSPMLHVEHQGAQSLMDELWKVGIRPSDIGTPGHLAATKEHLNDMRKLVSKSYGLTL